VLSSLILLLLSPETERLLLGPSPFFRAEGMERALREGDNELLLRASKSPHWDARRLAAIALGKHTPPRLLRDPVAVVREAAVRALDRRAPAADVIVLLKDEDDAVRAAAAWALRGTETKRPLQALLRDPAPSAPACARWRARTTSPSRSPPWPRSAARAVRPRPRSAWRVSSARSNWRPRCASRSTSSRRRAAISRWRARSATWRGATSSRAAATCASSCASWCATRRCTPPQRC
ncbi:MAG: HEAT repeat domain-containing protein, partial [Planctomycetota bacterium]